MRISGPEKFFIANLFEYSLIHRKILMILMCHRSVIKDDCTCVSVLTLY
jgi:hypothetical protein